MIEKLQYTMRGVSRSLALSRRTILIGPNRSGKSTALEAYKLALQADLSKRDVSSSAPADGTPLSLSAEGDDGRCAWALTGGELRGYSTASGRARIVTEDLSDLTDFGPERMRKAIVSRFAEGDQPVDPDSIRARRLELTRDLRAHQSVVSTLSDIDASGAEMIPEWTRALSVAQAAEHGEAKRRRVEREIAALVDMLSSLPEDPEEMEPILPCPECKRPFPSKRTTPRKRALSEASLASLKAELETLERGATYDGPESSELEARLLRARRAEAQVDTRAKVERKIAALEVEIRQLEGEERQARLDLEAWLGGAIRRAKEATSLWLDRLGLAPDLRTKGSGIEWAYEGGPGKGTWSGAEKAGLSLAMTLAWSEPGDKALIEGERSLAALDGETLFAALECLEACPLDQVIVTMQEHMIHDAPKGWSLCRLA